MSPAWVVVVLVGIATIAIKALGPVLLGGRPLPDRVGGVVGLLAPALLAALVAINTFGVGQRLTVDSRALGVAAAAVALRLRAPVLVVVVVAATVTATSRAVTG
jgi:branched-subunit amino acid transport protein